MLHACGWSLLALVLQVHGGSLHDGRRFAMKIQYPGVARSIESDVDNLMRLINIANLLPKGLYVEQAAEVSHMAHNLIRLFFGVLLRMLHSTVNCVCLCCCELQWETTLYACYGGCVLYIHQQPTLFAVFSASRLS